MTVNEAELIQPPSGGCVLKHNGGNGTGAIQDPAAFGRLCVETRCCRMGRRSFRPAAFGRLCVETRLYPKHTNRHTRQPPSGGCVLKQANDEIELVFY